MWICNMIGAFKQLFIINENVKRVEYGWHNLFFSFSRGAIYRESPAKIDVETDNIMVKNKSTITFHGLYSSRP